MFGIGAPELVLIVVLALIFIGPQKLPEIARMFGKSYREIQSSLEGMKSDLTSASQARSGGEQFPAKEHSPLATGNPGAGVEGEKEREGNGAGSILR